jgi:transketolase
MRAAFSDALVRFAKQDSRVLLLTGDHGYALFDEFRRECPNQYINAGIAEQNMVGMAAGLAKAGFIPFVYGLSAFVPVRVLEQIKLDIAHDGLHVVLLGDGAGFVYSHLGTSHQSTEDIAVTRAIPGLTVLSPADRFEQTLCMEWAYNANSSVYLRMGKADRGDVHSAPIMAELGDLLEVARAEADSPVFFATGSMLKTAVRIAEAVSANVWSVPAIKPVNQMKIRELLKKAPCVITFEEHSIYGGLGSMISEVASTFCPRKVLRIGVDDRFSELCGSYEYLLSEHNLDVDSILTRAKVFLEKKA